MIRQCYAALTFMAFPLIYLWIKKRARAGKEDISRLAERFGHISMQRPSGKLVWIHAASVGEANSIMPLLQRLHDAHPPLHIVLTTGTLSSAKIMASKLPQRAFHQFIPVDVPFIVKRFLSKLKPDLVVWVESEFWPNLIYAAHAQAAPMMLVNARISARSMQRWMHIRGAFSQMMRCFDAVYAGSPTDKQNLHELGVSKVEWVGNLKYDTDILPADPKETAAVMQTIGDRRIWLASSTHAGEEEIIAQVHRKVREVFPELLTIVVPRHPQRREELVSLFARHKQTVALRSAKQVILPETDIYIADTMGELGIFYRLAGVVFVGGSMVAHGGHNPIEPAQLDCAILCGRHMQNFADITEDLIQAKALIMVGSEAELADKVIALLRDHDAQEAMAARAHQLVDTKRGAVEVISARMLQQLGLTSHAEMQPEIQAQGEGL